MVGMDYVSGVFCMIDIVYRIKDSALEHKSTYLMPNEPSSLSPW